MTPIADNELGLSVRAKLNEMMRLAQVKSRTDLPTRSGGGPFTDDEVLVFDVKAGEHYIFRFEGFMMADSDCGVTCHMTSDYLEPATIVATLVASSGAGSAPNGWTNTQATADSTGELEIVSSITGFSSEFKFFGYALLHPTTDGTVALQWGMTSSSGTTVTLMGASAQLSLLSMPTTA